ncbi:DUF3347 domain-containing protein [Algoriphagus aestuarii]|nr:DUF3347 domain-containing protein [Algoriphagus aestuarii]
MKRLTKILLIASIISFTFACKENNKAGDNDEHMDHQEQMDPSSMDHSKGPESVSFENKEVSAIVGSYLKLKDALVETDGEKAKHSAGELVSKLQDSSLEGIAEMEIEAKKIAESTDPAVQRVSFDVLSNQMVTLVKSSNLTEGKLYKQYCPMAKNNEGAYWLSTSSEIRNPYFGDKMLKCGSVEEEI